MKPAKKSLPLVRTRDKNIEAKYFKDREKVLIELRTGRLVLGWVHMGVGAVLGRVISGKWNRSIRVNLQGAEEIYAKNCEADAKRKADKENV